MRNKEVKNKISVDESLRRKQERNEASKGNTRTNYKMRNKQIAIRHGQNTEDNLLGEAQIDLQHRLLEQEKRAIARFNNNYVALTDSVIASLDAQADEEAAQIESIEEIKWFVENNQLRPNLICNLYRITKSDLQELIDAHFVRS